MDSPSSSVIWPVVHAERRALLHDLRSLPAEGWRVTSLCEGWDVHDVVAHLIDSAKTTRWGFVRRMALARFDFDEDNARGVSKERGENPAATLSAFGEILDFTRTPPAHLATRLVEAFVHGEDIRVPLGIVRDYPVEHLATALRYQLATSAKLGGGRELAQGFTLAATDTDLVHGSGPEVRGSALSLLLAVSGRVDTRNPLTGPGAASFGDQINR
jgi:uncharacterized protein (TIGR03083 family)